jgi:poly-gamma-glutamate capsule biosynthesis protein CapA/YwtB (metallophosphatase superfamily)
VPPPVEIPIDKSSLRVQLAAVGDIMLGTDYPKNTLPDDDGVSFLSAVSPDLQAADVAFGNLEGVLMDGGEPEKTCSNPNACYLFRTPSRYAEHLASAGFDVMSLANNHAADFGEAGRESSMLALDSVGIKHSGRDGDVALWSKDDIHYALIAFSPTRGSHDLLSFEKYAAGITALAANNDIVIVSFHGGAEGQAGVERLGFGMEYAYGEQRGDVVAFARAMIDAGADVVIGHGPHIPRAIEIYRDRVIAYSLGNFATYYGISVANAKGYAPILQLELDGTGAFVNGRIDSYIQQRPGGPVPDSQQRAWRMIKELTLLDFPDAPIMLNKDGSFGPYFEATFDQHPDDTQSQGSQR